VKRVLPLSSLLLSCVFALAGCASSTSSSVPEFSDAARCMARCDVDASRCRKSPTMPPSCNTDHGNCEGVSDRLARQACLSQQSACTFDRLAPTCEIERDQCLQGCGR